MPKKIGTQGNDLAFEEHKGSEFLIELKCQYLFLIKILPCLHRLGFPYPCSDITNGWIVWSAGDFFDSMFTPPLQILFFNQKILLVLLLKSLFKSLLSLFHPSSMSDKSQNIHLGQNLPQTFMRFPKGISVTLIEITQMAASSDIVRVL